MSELELAYSLPSNRYGFEVFVPIADRPAPRGNGRAAGLSDISVRPLKLALFMRPEFVISTATDVRLPTGSKGNGLGSGATIFEQLLFADIAQGNWNLGINAGIGIITNQAVSIPIEYGALLGYSFIDGTEGATIAHVPHTQSWVPTLSTEFVAEHYLRRSVEDHDWLALVPGLALWHVPSGWQFRMGIEFPVFGQIEAGSAVLLQVGNHVKWL